MAEYGVPNWIQAANPAAATAQGIQIGAHIGAQQAAQVQEQAQMELARAKQDFYQQQAIKEQQLAAQRDARAQAEFGLQAAAAARKSEALLGYQKAVQSGEMDPIKAMMTFGPAMGVTGPTLFSAARAANPKASPTPQLVDLGGGVKGVQYGNQFHVLPEPKPAAQWTTENRTDDQGNPYQVQVNSLTGEEKPAPRAPITGRVSQIDRDELREMEREREHLQALADKDSMGESLMMKDPKTLNKAQSSYLDLYRKRAQRMSDLDQQIEEKRSNVRGQTPAPKPTSQAAMQVQRAMQLRAQHPDWDRQKVIDEVKKESANASGSANTTSQ